MSYQMHPEMKLGKVKLKVIDLQRSLDFYQNMVGFQLLRQEGLTAELTTDGQNALVELVEIPNAIVTPRRSVSGLYHYAILLPTRKDLGLVLGRLLEQGIHVGHSDHAVSEALYITDPDQNGIEIYRDRPRSEWTYDENKQVVMSGEPLHTEGVLKAAEGHAWEGLPQGTTMGHVHFHVGNLQKARDFYCAVLGFDLVMHVEKFGALFVSAGGYHHHIGLNIWAGEGAPASPAHATGIEYFTIIVPTEDDLASMLKRLNNAGVQAEQYENGVFLTDPFGIKMRIITSIRG